MEDRSIIVVDDVVDKPECRQMVIRKVCQCILVERLEPLPIYWVEAEDDASFEIRVLDVHGVQESLSNSEGRSTQQTRQDGKVLSPSISCAQET
jgi:hypothetical protein